MLMRPQKATLGAFDELAHNRLNLGVGVGIGIEIEIFDFD